MPSSCTLKVQNRPVGGSIHAASSFAVARVCQPSSSGSDAHFGGSATAGG